MRGLFFKGLCEIIHFKAEPLFLFLVGKKKKRDLVSHQCFVQKGMFALRNRHRDSMAVERGVPRAIQKEPRGRLCLFQDQETSFPRALSAQRLSPRWCFLDGECFCISWRAGGGEVQGKASMAAMDSSFPRDDSDTLHVAPRDWYLHLK